MLALSFICIFLVLAYLPEFYLADDEQYMACNQVYKCGSFSGGGYPFWGNGRPAFCGLRDFELDCSDPQSSSFSINIGSTVYSVLHLSHNKLTLVHADLGDNICFNPGYGLPLNSTDKMFGPFSYDEAGGKLQVFYNCRFRNATLPQGLLQSNLSCLHGEPGEESHVIYSFGNPMHVDGCKNSTTVHVPSSAYYQLWNKNITLEDAINQGFDVNYEAHQVDCAACDASGGRCGSDDHDRFICLCPDQPYSKACPAHGMHPFCL